MEHKREVSEVYPAQAALHPDDVMSRARRVISSLHRDFWSTQYKFLRDFTYVLYHDKHTYARAKARRNTRQLHCM